MAFNKKEEEIIRWSLQNGKTPQEAKEAIIRFRTTGSPQKIEAPQESPSFLADAVSDIKQTGTDLLQTGKDTIERVEEARDASMSGEQGVFRGLAQSAGLVAGGISKAIGDVFKGGTKAALPQGAEDVVKKGIAEIVPYATKIPAVKQFIEDYQSLDPKAKRDVDALFGTGALALDLASIGTTAQAVANIKRSTQFGNRIVESTTGMKRAYQDIPGVVLDGSKQLPDDFVAHVVDDIARKADFFKLPKVGEAIRQGLAGGKFTTLEQIEEAASGILRANQGLVAGTISDVGEVASRVGRSISQVGESGLGIFGKNKTTINSVDDLIEQADTALLGTAKQAGEDTLSLKEKFVGIQPDIKKRISGKQDKLREYFDVAHARNADDTLPSAYEYGAQRAQEAVDQMQKLLNETGGKIGATREKLGTYMAPIEAVQRVENTFVQQLDKLNLELRGGVVRQKPGTVSKAGSGDINALNNLYQDFRIVKQSPSLTNMIDLRAAFDSKINFGKRAAEVSNEIDPLSRQIRKSIADEAAKVVGKTEAAELTKFSNFMDAYNDLRSYTDRRAGGEYLLRLVLSGRGGEAREIINTINQYTGIDLLDDATMMTIATDLIGNSRQKNLFRQEVTKSGLDAARALSGDPSGAIGLMSDFIKKRFFDEEEIFLEAAK
jgi:hypothetical protein